MALQLFNKRNKYKDVFKKKAGSINLSLGPKPAEVIRKAANFVKKHTKNPIKTLKGSEEKRAQARALLEKTDDLPREIAQGTARTVAMVGTGAGNTVADLAGAPRPFDDEIPTGGSKITEAVFGERPIRTIGGATRKTKTDIAPVVGDKAAGIAALPIVIGSIGLDLSGMGGSDDVVKAIAKSENVKEIANLLRTKNVHEEVIKDLSETLATIKDPKKVAESIADRAKRFMEEVPFEGDRLPQVQISDEGIKMTSNIPVARQRALLSGEIKPGQPMPKKKVMDVTKPSRSKIEAPGGRSAADLPLSDSVTSTGQMLRGRGSENIETQLQRLRQSQGKGNGESLSNIIQKEVPNVKEKVGILDYLRTPEYVLKRIGLGNEAKLLRKQYEAYLDELPKNIEKITKWSESLPKSSNVRIFKYLDGQPVGPKTKGKGTGIMIDSGLTPAEQKVADEIKVWFKEFADRLGLPEDKRISHYITHIFEDNFIKKEFDPDLAKLIQGRIPGSVYDPFLEQRLGATGYIEDTWGSLDAYVKRATRKIHMDPALEALKGGANQKDISVVNYIQRYASRVNLRPTELENLIDTTFKQIFGYKFGLRPVNRVSRSLRQWVYRGTLGLNIGSAMRNLTQGVNTYAELGERWAIKGYFDILTKGAKELEEVGVLRDNFIQDRTISAVGKSIEKMDKGLFAFFELAEKINRGAAYFGGKSRALARGATPEEAIEAGKELVRKTQFQFGSIDTPVALQDDIAKTISQLQNFTVKQVEYLGGKIGRKEYAGVARYIAGSLVMYYTIGRLFGMEPKDMIPSFRFAAPPSLGIPAELSNVLLKGEDKYGQPYTLKTGAEAIFKKAIPFIPAGVQIRKTLEGLSAVSEGKDTTAGGRTKYKIDQTTGNYLKAALFGKNNLPEAQEYFKKQRKKKSPEKSKSSSSRYNF